MQMQVKIMTEWQYEYSATEVLEKVWYYRIVFVFLVESLVLWITKFKE